MFDRICKFLAPVCLFGVIFFVYLPMFVMVALSFKDGSMGDGMGGLTLKWYKEFFMSDVMISALKGSLIVGFISTFVAVFLATLLVGASYWWNPWWLLKIFELNLSAPEIFLVVILLVVFRYLSLPLGLGCLIVGHTLLGFGLAVPMIRSAIVDINPVLVDASMDLGASKTQTFLKVLLPLCKPVIVGACFMVFTLSLDDFFINYFCAGVGFSTVSSYVFTTAIRSSSNPSVNAMSATLLFFSFFLSVIFLLSKNLGRVLLDED